LPRNNTEETRKKATRKNAFSSFFSIACERKMWMRQIFLKFGVAFYLADIKVFYVAKLSFQKSFLRG